MSQEVAFPCQQTVEHKQQRQRQCLPAVTEIFCFIYTGSDRKGALPGGSRYDYIGSGTVCTGEWD